MFSHLPDKQKIKNFKILVNFNIFNRSTTMIISAPVNINLLAVHHADELRASAISDALTSLNFRTIDDSREVDRILNRNSKRRWKHSDELVPAWCVSGIDPLTDEPTLQGVQVKPDTPPIGKDGKTLKYLGAKDFDTAPLFLDTGLAGYWKSIIDDILKYVIITEGAKKAAAGLSIDVPTISIPGVATCRKNGRLHPLLEIFAVLGRTFYLCFDNDVLTKKPVQNALIGLSKELAAKGSKVMIVMLPEGEAKGMDDYIALYGAESFKELVNGALTFEEWKEYIDSQESEEEPYKRKSRVARNFQLISERWGEHLRYNTLKKRVELHGTELSADDVRLSVALEFDVDMSTSDAHGIIRTIAKANSYSPVVDYLDEMEAKFPEIPLTFLDNLAHEYFGTSDPMHSIFFKKFLVAAVARARKPGEKVDSVFMLASQKQGMYKSTFFRLLFGDDWFSDQLGDANDKDEKQKMHRFWGLEWAEFEHVYKKKDVATLKNFITSVEDTFRAPYDREPITYPRSCILFGTTNEQEILNDPTGDRRFWIVPVKTRIDIFRVMRDRDKIWAAANALYKSGVEWKLTDEEESKREILNRDYHSVDPWLEVIEIYLATNHLKFVPTDNLYSLLEIEVSKRTSGEARRISNVMRRLGWCPGREKINGAWRRGWLWELSSFEKIDFFTQNAILSGSSGSTSETQVIQGVQVDPDKNMHLDLSGSKGSDLPDVSNNATQKLIPEIQIDPDRKSYLDQLEPALDGGDPDDPDKMPSRAKKQNYEIGDHIRITSHPTRQDAIGQVEKIASVNGFLKTESGIHLYPNEVEKVDAETPSPTPAAKTELPSLPLLQEKCKYWSRSQKQEVTVFHIFDNLHEVSCRVPGRGTIGLPFTDLQSCQESPKHNFSVRDEVVILVGKRKDCFATITTIRADGIFLKADNGKAIAKAYFPHQIVNAG
jgi:predicted P-loop ATPase